MSQMCHGCNDPIKRTVLFSKNPECLCTGCKSMIGKQTVEGFEEEGKYQFKTKNSNDPYPNFSIFDDTPPLNFPSGYRACYNKCNHCGAKGKKKHSRTPNK